MELDDIRRARLGQQAPTIESPAIVVIGCGNLLRGDDGVGPRMVQRLAEGGVPDTVTLVDGGTAGMNVVSAMRGAAKLVLIDAVSTGAEPGTVYRVPGLELENLEPADVVVTHDLRWHHALVLGRVLLGEDHPDDVVVLLVEIAQTRAGTPLSEAVERSMQRVDDLVRAEWQEPR